MSMIIQANMPFINAQNKYKISTQNRAKSAEKLSSGYAINRAADDAAGLTISEKMRSQIRGLNRGTTNGENGVSWVHVADGALTEVHSILHRMKELTVQSLNDTNTEEDRAALQAEMDSLQSEIDRITDTTLFNEKNVFADHEATYYQFEGNIKWNQSQMHVVNAGENELTIKYLKDQTSALEELTISIPAGEYTTQELTDEIEDALIASGATEKGINVEYTNDGTFNINLEGGEKIQEVTGDLAKLLYDSYEGGSVGALIGTTSFPNDMLKLNISSENNNLSFDIEYFDGRSTTVDITLTPGEYTRPEIIEILNNELSGTTVTASSYGTGIKLGSDEAIITGFKGNMFKIDGGVNPYTSIFYDNVKYGSIYMTSGSFVGGTVIPDDSRDAEHHKFNIKADNNQLTFTANGSDTLVTITIPEGDYTIYEMRDKLNELFTDAGLELNAVVNDSGSYNGLTINSTVKGVTSQVGLSSSSSAYNTLFVNRVYNSYKTDAVVTRDTTADRQANFTGSKAFTGSNPLTITEDNNEFQINIDGNSYTIKLDNGIYNTAADIQAEIDDKLNGTNALSGYKGMVDVSVTNGKIKLTAAAGNKIINLSASGVANDNGYDNIFVGKKETVTYTSVSNTGSATSKPSITLNTPITDPTTITDADKYLTIKVNGTDKTVTLPTGDNVTHDDIINAIETQLQEKVITTDNTFVDVNGQGTTTSNHFNYTGTAGNTSTPYKKYTGTGSSTIKEGELGYSENIPAQVEMEVAIPEKMTIDSSNNSLQLAINGQTKTITLSDGTYSRTQLVNELQNKINAAFGTAVGGATVSLNSDNELVFKARLDEFTSGATTSIEFTTSTSSFVSALHTTESSGYVTTKSMLSSITITDDSNQFSFNYTEDGVDKTANITLDNGTYSRQQFVNMLNNKLDAQGVKVTASLSGSALKLATDTTGDDGNSVSINSQTLGSSVEAIFGPMVVKTAAVGTAARTIQSQIIIDENTDEFNITVNGNSYSIELEHDTYDRAGFVQMLNDKLLEAGAGISVELDSNKLKFTTDKVGSESTFKFTYASGGSSMKSIYGQTTTTYPGVTAEFNSDNQLVLTGTQNGGSLSVNSNSGSMLQEPNVTVSDIAVSSQSGYYSNTYATANGVNIGSTVVIDEWNDELNFVYTADGTNFDVSIDLEEKEYTHSELQTALQDEIDRQLGAGELTVTVDSTGVVIKAEKAGSKYYMEKNKFSGDFYYKVMCSTKETTSTQTPQVKNGTAPTDTAYTVGRKDVRNNPVEIKTGINDTLSIDLQYGNNSTTFNIKLDSGIYRGNDLKEMIQKKLNEELVNQGFPENMIEVGIGGISTGVVGSNDANALNFKLSSSVRLPVEGTYIIDGVKGNAAFSIFYQTDGELVPAYVKGAKDLSEGVTIEAGKEDLSFEVEGTQYSITIPAGKYTGDEIIDTINAELASAGAPVGAELDEGILKISHSKLGEHKISNITGGAKQALFFQENGEIGEQEEIRIQLSSKEGDYITLDKPLINTVSLGINSIAITDPKYANKALNRIDKAVNMVSQIRGDLGAKQNRLEHAILSNKNAAENTQASESKLRDLDMADEMVKFSKESILMQVGEAMMAQANMSAQNVLKLLNS